MNQWTQLPKQVHAVVARTPGSVLLQTLRFDETNYRSLLFLDAVRTISAKSLDEMPELFRQIEAALAVGLHVAGYLSYECGYHFEHFDYAVMANDPLLAWFGIYRAPIVYDHRRGCFEGDVVLPDIAEEKLSESSARLAERVGLEISREEYCRKIERIKEYIAAGETYQVNFTDRVKVDTGVASDAMFGILLEQQPVAYAAFFNNGAQHVLSFSPELFFQRDGDRIVTRPMKGTMPRGLDAIEDAEMMVRLRNDEKNRSEHVMIVDLLRNDLGRVCEMGSVRVEDIFSVEKYATLLQMTSTVSGTLRDGISYYEIFKGVFPSGSITGAPKIRTMEIIRELEQRPRGIYTGAIGYISPEQKAVFNVAIRTVVLKDGVARMGVGGGIVADSEPLDEYRECLLKAEFLTRSRREFQLIETMLWDGEFSFLDMHLDRLRASAEYFDFGWNRGAVAARLTKEAGGFKDGQRYRVRLLMEKSGAISITSVPLTVASSTGRICLSREHTSSRDVFLRHKTTERRLYERCYAEAVAKGFDEVIFINERGEITEGAISNVFIRKAGRLMTPPLSSGVLPGIYRRHLLETDANAEECVLTLNDLEAADVVLICNSVRGLRKVKLILDDDQLPG